MRKHTAPNPTGLCRESSAVAIGRDPLPVAPEGQALGQVDDRLGATPRHRGRVEDVEIAGPTVDVVDDREEPALVVAVAV